MKRKNTRIGLAVVGVLASLLLGVQYVHADDNSLITHWRFDEPTAGSTVADTSGSHFDGTPHGVIGGSDDPSFLPQPSNDVPTATFSDRIVCFLRVTEAIARVAMSTYQIGT